MQDIGYKTNPLQSPFTKEGNGGIIKQASCIVYHASDFRKG
ncbi:MAG: hypothetical protein ACOYU0_04985 [Nitrospirota bacterium]